MNRTPFRPDTGASRRPSGESGIPLEAADERGGKEAVRADDAVVAASEVRHLEERVHELRRGRGPWARGSLKSTAGGLFSGSGHFRGLGLPYCARLQRPDRTVDQFTLDHSGE